MKPTPFKSSVAVTLVSISIVLPITSNSFNSFNSFNSWEHALCG
jgi:hypothetical protein